MFGSVRKRLTPARVDQVVSVALAAVVALEASSDRQIGVLAIVGGTVVAASVAFRRQWPALAVVAAGCGATIADRAGGSHLTIVPIGFALVYYLLGRNAAERGPRIVDWVILAAPLPGIAFSPGTANPGDILLVDIVSIWVFFMVLPAGLGWVVAKRRRLSDAVRSSVEELAAEQRASEERAASDERTRIARELHDVIAHSVSVMVIQTQVARVVASRDPAAAVAALTEVQQCGRDALFDVRRMVGVLRRDGGDLWGAVTPGVAQLGHLVDRTRAAGLPAHLMIEGDARPLPPFVDLVVFRVVQEALTNTLKHAGPAQVRIVLQFSADGLDVDVADSGQNRRASAASSSSGHGLIGMRERLAVVGGHLDAGFTDAGGFRVHATIPRQPAMG